MVAGGTCDEYIRLRWNLSRTCEPQYFSKRSCWAKHLLRPIMMEAFALIVNLILNRSNIANAI